MAEYAFLNGLNQVVEVITGRNADEVVDGISDWETHYEEIRGLRCKRTSIDAGTNGFRKNYAGIGFVYDEELDAFIAPPAFDSWILNRETCQWEPPLPYPVDGKTYGWYEPSRQWIEFTSGE